MKRFQHSKFFLTNSLISGMLVLCLFLLFPTLVCAGGTGIGLYKDCYFADDFGGRKKDRLLVRPIGEICYERCEVECNGMLGKQEGTEPALNIDLVQKCKKDCRSGDKSKTYPLKVKGADGSIITKPVTIGSACVTGNTAIDANGNNVTRSSFVVKKNEELFIKLFPTANDGYGKLSLCGTDSVVLTPVSESLDDSSWPAFPWSTAASSWGARNPYPVDTGIDVKDGDLLSITLETKNGSYFAFKDPQHETSKLWVRNPFGSNEYWIPQNGASMNSKFSVLADKNLVAIKQNDDGTYEDGMTGSSISDIGAVMLANNDVKWNGLSGKADTVPIIGADGKTTGVKRVYKYSGQLDGFSDKFTRLGLMHFENISTYNSGKWADNLGGFTVNIYREGCIYRDGQRLQYAVLKEDTGSTPDKIKYISEFDASVAWKNLTDSTLRDYEPIKMDSDGLVVFRIQPLTKADEASFEPACTASINPICLDSLNRFDNMYGPANSDGKYLVQVEQLVKTSIQSGVVSDIVRKVKQYLFGQDANSTGTVQKLFNQFVEDSRFVTMIQAAILLFMTWTGFSYMVGLAQITQRDGVIRLVTLGIVLALLQPASWEFFNTYLFSLFIDGGGVLIANFINYEDYGQAGTAKDIADVVNDPSLAFSLFDKIFNIFLSAPFWYKILALVFSGWLGIYVFFAIFIAVVIFTVGLIKGFIIYMISMIMMGILLLLAPIFITFLLFKYTRKMFTSWLGQLISVTLQPVVVIASIGIFANLFLAGIYAALGFTACKICFIGFSIPAVLPFYCLIPGFTTLNMIHSPDDAILVSPVTNLAAALYVFIIAHAMYVFVAHSISLLNTIINQNFFTGVNLAGYSNIADYTTGALSTAAAPVNYALGRSEGVKAARQSIDTTLRSMGDKFGLGRDVENNKQTYSKVSEALREVAARSGGTLKDQDYDKFMKNLGAKDSQSDADYNRTIKSKVDKIALLENSTLTKDEIVQAMLRPPEKDTPLVAGGETMFKRLTEGGASDRFEELLERARSTQRPKPQAANRSLIDDVPGSG